VIKTSTGHSQVELKPLLKSQQLLAYQELILKVEVPPGLVEYTVELVSSSRPSNDNAPDFVKEYIAWGAGLRASQYITLGAKSRAAMSGRMTSEPEDVRAVVAPVMRHRIGLSFRADVDKVTVEDIITRLVEAMPVPAGV
jgi:MoxR-like ATPase